MNPCDLLSEEQQTWASQMAAEGADDALIADRIHASIAAVRAYLRWNPRRRRVALPADDAPTSPDEASPPDSDAAAALSEPESPSFREAAIERMRGLHVVCGPDVALTAAQRAAVQRLLDQRIPATVIAQGLRIAHDQVLRIARVTP